MAVGWQSTVFAVAIALIFVPMVFLGVNTFFPEHSLEKCQPASPLNECYQLEANRSAFEKCMDRQENANLEARACFNQTEQQRRQQEGLEYVTIMVICLITSLVLLLKFNKSIVFGLFAGVVLTAFIATIRYTRARSIAGFALLVALFLVIIYFIQRGRH